MFITARAVNSRRFIFMLYVVLLTGISIGVGGLLLEARGEYNKLKRDQAASAAKLHAARTRLKDQQRILERLRADPVFVEKVIRKQLGYAGQKEVIFRFDPGL